MVQSSALPNLQHKQRGHTRDTSNSATDILPAGSTSVLSGLGWRAVRSGRGRLGSRVQTSRTSRTSSGVGASSASSSVAGSGLRATGTGRACGTRSTGGWLSRVGSRGVWCGASWSTSGGRTCSSTGVGNNLSGARAAGGSRLDRDLRRRQDGVDRGARDGCRH